MCAMLSATETLRSHSLSVGAMPTWAPDWAPGGSGPSCGRRESHDAIRRGHGGLALGRYRADQQDLGFQPSPAGKQRCEGNQYGYNGIGQGEHGWAVGEIWAS